MKKPLTIFLLACVASNACNASKAYDVEAGAVIKNSIPCFYSSRSLPRETPENLQGEGVSFSVFDRSSRKYHWEAWFRMRPTPLPTSPQNCIPYGVVSPERNDTPVRPLNHDVPYQFDMTGEMGRQRVYFCLRKDTQGRDYLSKMDGNGNCSTEPLNAPPKSFWQRLLGDN